MSKLAWEQKGEWTHARIFQTRRGWMVCRDARFQGMRTGVIVTIPFSSVIEGQSAPVRGADLYKECNVYGLTFGEWIERAAIEGCGRVLAKGWIVR